MCDAITQRDFDVVSSEGTALLGIFLNRDCKAERTGRQAARKAAIPTPRVVPRAIFALWRTPE